MSELYKSGIILPPPHSVLQHIAEGKTSDFGVPVWHCVEYPFSDETEHKIFRSKLISFYCAHLKSITHGFIKEQIVLNNPEKANKYFSEIHLEINQIREMVNEAENSKQTSKLILNDLLQKLNVAKDKLQNFKAGYSNFNTFEPEPKPKTNKTKPITSFNWIGTPEQLKALYKGLDENAFIDTTEINFINAIIGGKAEPVKLKMSNRVFAYLMQSLFLNSLFSNKYWQSYIDKNQLFENENGKLLKRGDIAVANSNNNNEANPFEAQIIDLIIDSVKRLSA